VTTRINLGGDADKVIRIGDMLYAYADGTLWEFCPNNLYGDWQMAKMWPEELKLVDGTITVGPSKKFKSEILCDCNSRDLLHVGHKCGR